MPELEHNQWVEVLWYDPVSGAWYETDISASDARDAMTQASARFERGTRFKIQRVSETVHSV